MPRMIVEIDVRVGEKKATTYAVYSTIVSDWVSGFHASIEDLVKENKEFENLPVVKYKEFFGDEAEAYVDEEGRLVLKYPVYVFSLT